MNFESASEIERKREELRAARQIYLEKAKEQYEKEERKKELARARGEDTWMLSSVNQRLEQEQESIKSSKKKKKEKKKKSKKKKSSSSELESDKELDRKKKKKYKKRKNSSTSSESDNVSQWVEKSSSNATTATDTAGAIKGPRLERDSWMSAPMDIVPTITRKELIERKNKEKEEFNRQRELLNKPGTHAKELNPYWKDGGTGVPVEVKVMSTVEQGQGNVGDAGLSWLRKSYDRCVQQAKEEGRSLEELAAERWGSLEKIQTMLKEAEEVKYGRSRSREAGSEKRGFMKPSDSGRYDEPTYSRGRFQRPRSGSRDRSRRSSSSHRRRSRSGSQDGSSRSRGHRSGSNERSSSDRSRPRRSRSQERNERRRKSRSSSRSKDSRERSLDRKGSNNNESDRLRDRQMSSFSGSLKGRFMKPSDTSGSNDRNRPSSRYNDSGNGGAPAWKKKEFHKPGEGQEELERMQVKAMSREGDHKRSAAARSDSTSSSSSDSNSSESSDDDRKGQGSISSLKQPEVRILSEKEMNDLGAKIVKAEIMGNEELAAKLKGQLEAAREFKKNAPQGQSSKVRGDDEEFVTLTRTDRSGMSRPLPEGQFPAESGGGKRRRKKQKVDTHSGKEGERTRYFDDDDKHDLKTLVEREKLGTAEDQNQMFARLAGRSRDRTDDDFQVDDVFLSKASQKQSESVNEQRDRAAAIFEHRKMSSALDKCNFCFNNVAKHLIIAIGSKVYLSLPNHRSLTEGHCLLVPMQHVASSTALDEDVWSEMQVFRKTLTKMFEERGEDVVFMETCMRLKHFPHMCLECVPLEKEVGDMAPIYFKKAIQESESEWSQNKKVIDMSRKDIRHSVPRGFPYFAVDFGNEGGFAHVIEDEQKFPHYFGKEILGGMIDADHRLWKKPPRENFDDQRRKVMAFAEMWKPHDWTQNISKSINKDNKSSSSSSSSGDSD
ncbi:CWF19-like protein 2 isoform X2 [Dreissena polymorpha]|uniref:CWF19-like protein 2 isoform X2 n=1 Tax=Dreissena polymorpha TaxID=45954 RepID=UPI002263F355|nr:CWF19-like protein 2 isoform X2 [Dreissena polymorpha]